MCFGSTDAILTPPQDPELRRKTAGVAPLEEWESDCCQTACIPCRESLRESPDQTEECIEERGGKGGGVF